MANIYYFCPDFSPPSGGTKRLYRHVLHLNKLGFNAFIVHYKKGFFLTWHGYEAPVLWLEDNLNFGSEDTLVFPEGMPGLMKQTGIFKCKRVVIALNWAYIYNSLPHGENWKDYGVTHAITPSPVIKSYIEESMGIDATLIDSFIDGVKYSHKPKLKRNKIVYLTRKDKTGEVLRHIFERKVDIALGAWEWALLDGLSEDQYANIYRRRGYFWQHRSRKAYLRPPWKQCPAAVSLSGFPGSAEMIS